MFYFIYFSNSGIFSNIFQTYHNKLMRSIFKAKKKVKFTKKEIIVIKVFCNRMQETMTRIPESNLSEVEKEAIQLLYRINRKCSKITDFS